MARPLQCCFFFACVCVYIYTWDGSKISWLKLPPCLAASHQEKWLHSHHSCSTICSRPSLCPALQRMNTSWKVVQGRAKPNGWILSNTPVCCVFNSYFSLWFIFKAIMRSFSLLQDAIVPYIPTLIDQLTQKLLLVSKVIHTDASNSLVLFSLLVESTGMYRTGNILELAE